MNQDEIITLYNFKDILEATLAVDKLKANKIESFLQDDSAAGVNPLAGVELKVFSKDLKKADKLILEFKD